MRKYVTVVNSDLGVSQEKKSCIRVNTREINRVPSTKLSTLYTLDYWSVLQYH